MCTKLMMSWYCWQVITGIVCIDLVGSDCAVPCMYYEQREEWGRAIRAWLTRRSNEMKDGQASSTKRKGQATWFCLDDWTGVRRLEGLSRLRSKREKPRSSRTHSTRCRRENLPTDANASTMTWAVPARRGGDELLGSSRGLASLDRKAKHLKHSKFN